MGSIDIGRGIRRNHGRKSKTRKHQTCMERGASVLLHKKRFLGKTLESKKEVRVVGDNLMRLLLFVISNRETDLFSSRAKGMYRKSLRCACYGRGRTLGSTNEAANTLNKKRPSCRELSIVKHRIQVEKPGEERELET